MPILLLLGALALLAGCAGFQKEEPQATLAIQPADQLQVQDEAIALKKKVAVGRFTNETRLANSFLNEGSGSRERMSRAATDILTAKLAKSNRFVLIERADTLAIGNELRISNIQSYRIPTDYLILGSISEFGRNTSGEVGLIDRTKKQTAYAKVTIRIVDTRTGMVIFGEEGSGEASSEVGTVLGMGSQAGYDETLSDKAIDAAIADVITDLINKLSLDPWRSYILNLEGDYAFISGGALQGIREGDVFKVYQRGKLVTNPQSGIQIELPGTEIARLRVVQVYPGDMLTELSSAQVIEGNIPADALETLYISDK
jgi:curli biogenesis system outer membrane secretion channel CsgG